MKRESYLVGNWKMNQSLGEIEDFFKKFFEGESEWKGVEGLRLWIAPQYIHLEKCLSLVEGRGVGIGSQNCSCFLKGSYTGEVSPRALREMGAFFTLLGHSERRTLFGESEHRALGKKVATALSEGLAVVFCLGETLEEREAGKTFRVLEEQLLLSLREVPWEALTPDKMIFAYEPVWAIGTGKTATSEVANSAHGFIRGILGDKLALPSEQFSILYGGSVKGSNAEDIFSQEHIDGGLVGGASLGAEDFLRLAHIGRKSVRSF